MHGEQAVIGFCVFVRDYLIQGRRSLAGGECFFLITGLSAGGGAPVFLAKQTVAFDLGRIELNLHVDAGRDLHLACLVLGGLAADESDLHQLALG